MPRARLFEHTLYLAQFGMLRKDDFLEVVFNPGSDKVEQWVLGPASATGGDTGSAAPDKPRPRTQPSRNLTAELCHCIGGSRIFQFCGAGKFACGAVPTPPVVPI